MLFENQEVQKAVINAALKIGTTIGSSVGSIFILKSVHEFDEPVDVKSKEGMVVAVKRAARDSCITAGCSITGSVVYNVAAHKILD